MVFLLSDLDPKVVALLLGLASASSFPIGAALGLAYPLGEKTLAVLLSFGAGALLFALTIELFAEQLEVLEEDEHRDLALGLCGLFAFIGAVLFVVLNSYIGDETTVEEEGPDGQSQMLSQRSQRVRIFSKEGPGHQALMGGGYGSASRAGFKKSGSQSQGMSQGTNSHSRNISRTTFEIDANRPSLVPMNSNDNERNEDSVLERLAGGKAGLSMWLGVMLDGIPESMVFGFQAMDGKFSIALVLGVFLSNFPEAVSAAAMMKAGGKSNWYVFWLWFSLVVTTGFGAYITVIIFAHDKSQGGEMSLTRKLASASTEGLAGGAMLAMVSSTMLPEAFHKGGQNTVSFMTVFGFLVAFLLKSYART